MTRPRKKTLPRRRDRVRTAGRWWRLAGLAVFGAGGLLLLLLVTTFFVGSVPARDSLSSFRIPSAACTRRGAAAVYDNGYCYPTERARCEAAGGVWGLLGATSGVGCTGIAPDGGERCRSGATCTSGSCLALLTPTLLQRLTETQRPVEASGLCAGLTRVRGCNAEVHDGFAQPVVCRT